MENLKFDVISKAKLNAGEVEFQLIDILGQVIYQQKAGVNNGDVQCEMRPFISLAGAYYLRVRAGDKFGVHKVIIQK